jgi:polygalacturonase
MTDHALSLAGIPQSELFAVYADGKQIPVFEGYDHHFAHIVLSDTAEIEVKVSEPIQFVNIRPTRRQKSFRIQDNSVFFTVCRGEYLSFEINGDIDRPLILFADAPMSYGVYDGYTVHRFRAGTHTKVGKLTLESNTVVIIEEGAVVEGCLWANGAKNLKVLGGGVLLYDHQPENPPKPIFFDVCEDVEIDGITIVGFHTWNLHIREVKRCVIENIKILAHEIWSDGIDIVGCEDVLVRHIFIKNEDDCVCIKSSLSKKGDFRGFDVRRVLVEDCVLWNGPRGNSLEIGYETNNSTVENVLFRHVDVLHRETQASKFNRAIIAIHNSGNAAIKNITYEDIYAESTDENFVVIGHMHQPDWGTGSGSIEDITIRNLTLAGGELRPSKIFATAECSHERRITNNIIFENLTVLGEPIKDAKTAEKFGFTLEADNVKFL